MTRPRTAALLACAVATHAPVVAAPGHADPGSAGGPFRLLCGLSSPAHSPGMFSQPGLQIGTMNAGPLVADTSGLSGSVTVTCSVQVGGSGAYAEADAASVSGTNVGVTYVTPTPVSYQVAPGDPVWVCTTVTES